MGKVNLLSTHKIMALSPSEMHYSDTGNGQLQLYNGSGKQLLNGVPMHFQEKRMSPSSTHYDEAFLTKDSSYATV